MIKHFFSLERKKITVKTTAFIPSFKLLYTVQTIPVKNIETHNEIPVTLRFIKY